MAAFTEQDLISQLHCLFAKVSTPTIKNFHKNSSPNNNENAKDITEITIEVTERWHELHPLPKPEPQIITYYVADRGRSNEQAFFSNDYHQKYDKVKSQQSYLGEPLKISKFEFITDD